MNDFLDLLQEHGADPGAVFLFEEGGPDLLPYATLLDAHAAKDGDLSALLGVYEWQRAPLAFFLDGDQLGDDPQRLLRIRRRLAMRGDAPYLGVARPGRLTFYHLALDKRTAEQAQIAIPDSQPRATLAYLANRRPGPASARRQWIAKVVLKLLDDAIQALQTHPGITVGDAISLVGRALFSRFLADRKLLPLPFSAEGARQPEHLFDDATQAVTTSRWLDSTFNGDFLPLSPGLFERLPDAAYRTLGDILRRAPDGQLHLGWIEKWDDLDFAHIPVGVLSQAYENHLSKHQDKQRKEGGYYTPRPIADLMVRGAFHALHAEGKAHTVKVLDPAAGAGVFLLTAFRQLVAERWRHDDRRPDTDTLREILYGQIAGFDINESALRFAALGLYLLTIELDPHPEPVTKLKFQNLRGTVLHKVAADSGDAPSTSLGSLGDAVGPEHVGRYDLVIGNPPWSSATQLAGWESVLKKVAAIARPRLPEDSPAPPLPNEVMDLPFVWRAMEWAKPGGQIAFALHARLLFQQGDGMPLARGLLFRALDVSGVVNGAELRHTRVWPEIAAPFCLLFARNRVPQPGAVFRFVSPHEESRLNDAGGMRLDVAHSEWVTSEQVTQRPELLKILFRGGRLDLEVFDRMAQRGIGTLEGYWRERFECPTGRIRYAGNGYQMLRNSTSRPMSAEHLCGMPELPALETLPPLIDVDALPEFSQREVHRARSREIYSAPLLIVHKSPPVAAGRIRVAVSDSDLVFNMSYYGYSARLHPNGELLVRYLALVVGSKPAFWHCLVTSGAFGFERDVVEKFTIDSIPVPPFETLSAAEREQIAPLFDAVVQSDNEANWARVDAWVAGLYGLSARDLQVIADTLAYKLPFAANRRAAQAMPGPTELDAFRATLAEELAPWAERAGKQIEVRMLASPAASPWRVLQITTATSTSPAPVRPWPAFFDAADKQAASEILLPDPDTNSLWVGRLDQARYWSRSQARLLARQIVWEHLPVLTGQA
jgi:hypothetical protein